MKKKIIYAMIIPLMVLFISCRCIAFNYEYYDSHCGIALSYKDESYPIYSEEEKNLFLSDYNLNNQFIEKLKPYDENYFSTKYIVILVMPASSSSVQYKLKSIDVNEKIEFKIKMISKEIMTDDIVNKAFIVELPNDLSEKDCEISIIEK